MAPTQPTVLLFGDVTDSWVSGLDYVFEQATTTPYLHAFLEDLFAAIQSEVRGMDRFLRDSFGSCSSFHELAQRYRNSGDQVGMVHSLLLYTVRAALLLKAANREPMLLNPGEGRPETHLVGISAGIFNAVATSTSADFNALYDTCIETGRVWARASGLTLVRSKAMEDSPDAWGYAVVDIAAKKLEKILDQFQSAKGVPVSKRVKVAITGYRWSTVVGPPSVMKLVMGQCPELQKAPKNELPGIRAMQHGLAISEADIDLCVGESSLLAAPVRSGYKIWGIGGNDPNATYSTYGELLRAAVLQTLAQPLDIVQTLSKLSNHLGKTKEVDIKMMGPSGHTAYVVNVLKAGAGSSTRRVSVDDDMAAKPQPEAVREGAIAIIGMAGKGPGADDLDEFWNVIETGKDCHEEIPAERFNLDEYYCEKHGAVKGANGEIKCTMACRHGCFMRNPGHFDAKFFHISPREALLMDPVARQFMMSAWEALEMAGYSAGQTRATDPNKTGVFFGASADDWYQVSHAALGCDAYTLQGMQRAFAPGRLAFQMKWEGPTYALDSACAGATSAIHLASMSLLSRDVDMAVAGATNVLSDPHSFTLLAKAGVLSDTGNCKTYRDDADGYCRADFSGALILKRLDDAIAQNDNILAVIAASARNHSGNSTSITTSDANAQERLFNKVIRNSRLAPHDVSHVEMHGTGTQVGDKAEMTAVSRVFSPRRPGQPLTVGAIKANIGHSEAAAGMSSVLKSILMLQKGTVPPQAGMPHGMNPNVEKVLKGSGIVIPMESMKFSGSVDKPKRILVNNFDAAGGNACVIIEEYKGDSTRQRGDDPRSAHVITSSARTEASYIANLRRLAGWLRAKPNSRIQDVAYSTTARRVQHPIRFAFSASTTQGAISELDAEIARATAGKTFKSKVADVVFVFTGQGSHYAGMGAELYRTSPVFQKTVDLCVALCAANKFPAFLDIITNSAVNVADRDAAQIQLAVVTLEIALTAFWKSAGIVPAMVMGHSLGEYAALHAAGVLSLSDTLYLVGQRAGLLLERCEVNSCAMLSVSAPVSTVRELLAKREGSSCGVACINSPNATVISGSAADLAQFKADITAKDAKTRTTMLAVPFAFHSSQMDAILPVYQDIASRVTYMAPKVPVASTLLAAVVDKPGVFNEDYLVRQTRQAVDFCGGLNTVKSALKNPYWLELGPGPICSSFVRATLSPPAAKINHTIDANSGNWASISKSLATANMNGAEVDWLALHAPYEANLELLSLPTYAWDVKNYWITHTERKAAQVAEAAPVAAPVEPFLGTTAQYLVEKTLSPKVQVTFRADISEHGFMGLIDGHKMQSIGLASGSVFSDAAATMAKYTLEYSGKKDVTAANLTFHDPELLAPVTRDLVGTDGTLFSTATIESASAESILVTFKATSKKGQSHDLGSIRVKYRSAEKVREAQASLDRVSFFIKAQMEERIRLSKSGSGHRMQPGVFYALFANAVEFSSDFRAVQEAYVADDFQEAAASVVLPADPEGTRFTSSPYWGEGLLHLAGFMVNGNPGKSPASTFVVMGYDHVEQLAPVVPGKQYLTYTRITRWEKDTAFCAAYVFDPQTSKIVMQAVDLRYQEFKTATWRHILGGHHGAAPAHQAIAPRAHVAHVKPAPKAVKAAPVAAAPVVQAAPVEQPAPVAQDGGVFKIITDSLATATGSDPSEFTDDTLISDVGVDSIMAIEVVGALKEVGVDLPAGFVFEFPTIGDLRREFGGPAAAPVTAAPAPAPVQQQAPVKQAPVKQAPVQQQAPVKQAPVEQAPVAQDSGAFQIIVDSLATATGSDPSEFTDDTLVSDVGVDSIMAIEVVGALKEVGIDLPAGFVFEYPTIGDLRRAFGGQDAEAQEEDISATPSSDNSESRSVAGDDTVESVSSVSSSLVHVEKEVSAPASVADTDSSPQPSVRLTLLHGRPNAGKTPLYMIADGTGSVAVYLHLRPFKSKQAVYGIDSPYTNCPSRLTSEVGIQGVAKLIVDALIKAQPTGPFQIGGYSAGSLVAFEVARQLAHAGRKVDGLLLVDLCSPRSQAKDHKTLLAEDEFSYDVFHTAVNKGGLWSNISASRDHFRAFFVAMNTYTGAPMTAAERPAKTAVIWAEKGLVNRVSDDPALMKKLEAQGVPTKAYPGYMEDPKLGTFACLVPDKGANVGPNGWDKYTGGDVLAMSVPGDHFELPLPGHVHQLQAQMEKAFAYFASS